MLVLSSGLLAPLQACQRELSRLKAEASKQADAAHAVQRDCKAQLEAARQDMAAHKRCARCAWGCACAGHVHVFA
jgi:hypothetical protein